jgi:hypothetical protein
VSTNRDSWSGSLWGTRSIALTQTARTFAEQHAEQNSVFLCEKISRKGAKGAKRYVLLFLCQKYCTQITQNHADALRNFAPLREKKICPFVLMSKKIFHTELTEYTEFLLRNSIYFFVNRLNSTG